MSSHLSGVLAIELKYIYSHVFMARRCSEAGPSSNTVIAELRTLSQRSFIKRWTWRNLQLTCTADDALANRATRADAPHTTACSPSRARVRRRSPHRRDGLPDSSHSYHTISLRLYDSGGPEEACLPPEHRRYHPRPRPRRCLYRISGEQRRAAAFMLANVPNAKILCSTARFPAERSTRDGSLPSVASTSSSQSACSASSS